MVVIALVLGLLIVEAMAVVLISRRAWWSLYGVGAAALLILVIGPSIKLISMTATLHNLFIIMLSLWGGVFFMDVVWRGRRLIPTKNFALGIGGAVVLCLFSLTYVVLLFGHAGNW